MLRLLALTLALACRPTTAAPQASPEPAPAPESAPAPEPAAAPAGDPGDRSELPLARVRAAIDGLPFSLELPDGMKLEQGTISAEWSFLDVEPYTAPAVIVRREDSAVAPRDLDKLAQQVTALSLDKPPLVVTTRSQLPDGGLLVTAGRSDGQYFTLQAIHRRGEQVLRCQVIQRTGTGEPGERPIPAFEATRAWAERICASLKFE